MRALLAATLFLVAGFAGCATPAAEAPDVVATFYPLAWATERIAGPNVTVDTLVPAGVEPHDWEPTAADVARLAGAKVLVLQGVGFEPWLDGIMANLGERAPRVVVTTAGQALHADPGTSTPDPHTWLDPILFAGQTGAIQVRLLDAFPEEKAGILERGEALRAQLRELDAEYQQGLAACETRVVIANHDAYGYLARRYNFTLVAISGLSPEAEPSPEDLQRAIDAAREHDVRVIFFEELVSPRVAEVVAREVGAQTRVLSPIEGVSNEDAAAGADYASLMRENLVALREAMRCQ